MAQTRKKRRSKHRGTAAGTIESRGRTGRRPGPEERSTKTAGKPGASRLDRLNRPPSWRSAANRALVATVIFVAAVIFLFKEPVAQALVLGAFMLCIYIPMGYYTDQFLYRRRQRRANQS